MTLMWNDDGYARTTDGVWFAGIVGVAGDWFAFVQGPHPDARPVGDGLSQLRPFRPLPTEAEARAWCEALVREGDDGR